MFSLACRAIARGKGLAVYWVLLVLAVYLVESLGRAGYRLFGWAPGKVRRLGRVTVLPPCL